MGSAASLHARLQGFDSESLPLHWRQAVEDSDIPGCALFDHPCPVGPPPGARWGHASAAVGDRLYVFGGDGATMYSNGFMYDSGKLLHHAQLHSLQISSTVFHTVNDTGLCRTGHLVFEYTCEALPANAELLGRCLCSPEQVVRNCHASKQVRGGTSAYVRACRLRCWCKDIPVWRAARQPSQEVSPAAVHL